MDIAGLLRAARGWAGFSQSLLARLSGIAQPKISAYESGRESPSTRTLVRLLDACGSDLRLSGRRTSPDQMSRGARRSLENHRKIAAALLLDEAARQGRIGQARVALAEARKANPFGEHWHERWSDLLEGPVDGLVAALIGEDTHSIELRVNSPFVELAGDRAEEISGAAR